MGTQVQSLHKAQTLAARSAWWQTAIQAGLLGGIVGVLLCLIGLVTTFGARPIVGGVFSLGQTLLAGVFAFSAYRATRTLESHTAERQTTLFAGAMAGATSGAMLALLVFVGRDIINLRGVLINASEDLYRVLTFGQSTLVGAGLLIAFGLVIGLATAAVLLLPSRTRRVVTQVIAWVVLVGLMADLLRVTISQWGAISGIFTWLFSGKGLSIPGALAVAAVVVALDFLQAKLPARPVAAQSRADVNRQRWLRIGIIGLVLVALPIVLGTYFSEVFDQVGLFILMGLGLNIVVGFAGLLDLGYVAFFAIGAYTTGILTSPELGFFNLTWWEAVPIAVAVSILAGTFLGVPVLRLRGDYLAIVTLGFGEIIRILVLSDALKPYIGGSQGIQQIAKPTIGSFVFDDQQKLYYVLLAGCLLAAFVSIRLRDSRIGRAWMALREDEDVAQAMGINLVATKLLAFATGAAFSGLSGAIFAAKLGAAYPNSFGLLVSINVLALIIVGGMGSIPGVIIGAVALVGLPEMLREFAEYRLMVYGFVLVAMMLYRPEGLAPEAAHLRELHEDADLPDGTASGPAH
jgi:branched-chain amino acid transport system permease protein